jgi:hypothetical protein
MFQGVRKLLTVGIVLSAAATAVAVPSCYFRDIVECCNLVTGGAGPNLTRFCFASGNCPDIVSPNSIHHFKSPNPGQLGWPSVIPTDPCTCTYDRYMCSDAGYCVIDTPGVTASATPSVVSGTYGACQG